MNRAENRRDRQELDGDEIFALIVSLAIAMAGARRWYAGLVRVTPLGSRRGQRIALGLVPILCLVLVQAVLSCCSAQEVREGAIYEVLFLVAGAAWLTTAAAALHLTGISPRYDALEHRNGPAVIAVCGAWFGATCCYAGANIGEGATIWTTFVPAAAATAILFVLLRLLQLFASISNAISIDRDHASAVRLAGFLVAAGLILGRAVAGDFHSWGGTWHDFIHLGWPVLPLAGAALALQLCLRPTSRRPGGRIQDSPLHSPAFPSGEDEEGDQEEDGQEEGDGGVPAAEGPEESGEECTGGAAQIVEGGI